MPEVIQNSYPYPYPLPPLLQFLIGHRERERESMELSIRSSGIAPIFPSSFQLINRRSFYSTASTTTDQLNTIFHRRRRPWRRRRSLYSSPRSGLLEALESIRPAAETAAVLTAIVVVHESGHFLAAALQGIHVSKFAIGFGPAIARFTYGRVEYSLRAFPLGGFVGFPDDDPDSDIPADDADLLRNRPIPDRMIVVSAGVLANLAFAYIIIFFQVLSVGLPLREPLAGVLVPEVRSGSAAARAGILPGDVILAIGSAIAGDGIGVLSSPSVSEVVERIKASPGRSVPLKVDREGTKDDRDRDRETVVLVVVPDEGEDGKGKIGVQLTPNFQVTKARASNLLAAAVLAGREFAGLSSSVLEGLRQALSNLAQSAEKVSGPVAIIAVGAEVARSGGGEGLYEFAAVINLNLAAINLLPLPALDGGTLALLAVEAARGGRKIPKEVEQRITSSGVVLLLMLSIFLIVRDTLNLDLARQIMS